MEQHSYGRYSGRPKDFKAGIDFFANKKTTLGFVLTGDFQNDKFTSNSRANIFDSTHKFVQYNDAASQTHNPWTNLGFNVNFEQKLDTLGKELTADADYIFYRTKGKQYSYNYPVRMLIKYLLKTLIFCRAIYLPILIFLVLKVTINNL